MTIDEFKAICDLTVRLTELRQRHCNHLCIENFAPELLQDLMTKHVERSLRQDKDANPVVLNSDGMGDVWVHARPVEISKKDEIFWFQDNKSGVTVL